MTIANRLRSCHGYLAMAQSNAKRGTGNSDINDPHITDVLAELAAIITEMEEAGQREAEEWVIDCGQSWCKDHTRHYKIATDEGEPQGPVSLNTADLDGGDGSAAPERLDVSPGAATAGRCPWSGQTLLAFVTNQPFVCECGAEVSIGSGPDIPEHPRPAAIDDDPDDAIRGLPYQAAIDLTHQAHTLLCNAGPYAEDWAKAADEWQDEYYRTMSGTLPIPEVVDDAPPPSATIDHDYWVSEDAQRVLRGWLIRGDAIGALQFLDSLPAPCNPATCGDGHTCGASTDV